MNIENIKLLRDDLELSRSFTMRTYKTTCGTPQCIAGHAAYLACQTDKNLVCDNLETTPGDYTVDELYQTIPHSHCHVIAKKWLNIDNVDAFLLFGPDSEFVEFDAHPGNPKYITKKRAMAQLNYMIENGEIDKTWSM